RHRQAVSRLQEITRHRLAHLADSDESNGPHAASVVTREWSPSPRPSTSRSPDARTGTRPPPAENLVQRVGHDTETDHHRHDGQARETHRPPRVAKESTRRPDHVAP